MKKGILLGALSASLISGMAAAGNMGSAVPDWRWVGTFSAGPVWEDGGATQTFYITPDIEKSYRASKTTKTLGDFEVFLGGQHALSPALLGQLGLAVGATTDATLSGIIWDDADPAFNNFSYGYKVQHTHVAAKGKLLVDTGYWVMPWVSASIGVGFNSASNFHNTPLIDEAIKTPNFKAHTETAFTYTVGAGIQKALNEYWQIGAGYEFADWGQSHLGRASEQTMNQGLKLNHLYTNGVMFNLTYVA
jgi:opacity protein-like surface antigen